MLFPEEDAPVLKAWIVKRLENTSDADADVLAEYVLALLRHDGSVADVRKLCEQEIPDFLKEDSSVFVSDVFDAIQYKAYLPGPQAPPYDDVRMAQAPAAALPQNALRKRTYHELGDTEMLDAQEHPAPGRSFKQARRGRGGRFQEPGGYEAGPNSGGFSSRGYQPPQFPMPPPGLPPFDPNNPMEALLKLQSMGMPLPPMPDFMQQGPSPQASHPSKRRQRCRDYDTKGYCARGNTCMFEHGTDSIFVPPPVPLGPGQGIEEYDPNDASLLAGGFPGTSPPPRTQSGNQRGRGGHRDRQGAPRRGRAPFSAEGPVYDRSKSTIVVENIPEEYFKEDEVRGFFSQYGNIVEVSMQPYKHLATVKFDSWSAANAAYKSPKVIFDNRFVKVFWYKENGPGPASSKPGNRETTAGARNGSVGPNGPAGAESSTPAPEIDMEEFQRKQDEAQKAHEEKMKKVQQLEDQRAELEKRQEDLRAKQQQEREKLLARIAAKSKQTDSNGTEGSTDQGGAAASKPASHTEALRAQLAALEAEAKQLGLDPDGPGDGSGWSSRGGRGRGRGGSFRARGSAPRGFGSSLRGRGGGHHAAYAAYSLDNRPKKVSVTGVDFTVPEKDEMLRQYLFGIGEFTDIQTTPAATEVTFKDRKTAEKFFFGLANNEIPGVDGKVELGWVNGSGTPAPRRAAAAAAAAATSTTTATTAGGPRGSRAEDAAAAGAAASSDGDDRDVQITVEHPSEQAEMDYDVADDSQWDIG